MKATGVLHYFIYLVVSLVIRGGIWYDYFGKSEDTRLHQPPSWKIFKLKLDMYRVYKDAVL